MPNSQEVFRYHLGSGGLISVRLGPRGHIEGTSAFQLTDCIGATTGMPACLAVAPVLPRLLNLEGTAAYLGVSPWIVRDLEAAGILSRVRIPLPNGELRKLLFDRQELDHLVRLWKDGA